MDRSSVPSLSLPVGFERFHRDAFLDYQLNRAHALGFVARDALHDVARELRTYAACPAAFAAASARAEAAGRLREATGLLRLAEFFTPKRDGAGVAIYRRYRALFDRAVAGGGAVRHAVPYGAATLPADRLPAVGDARGTVLLHGGFDSLIEEFYAVWERLAAAGFDVVAFEGPGQGGARALGGLTFDHDWEKPVGAVLDHFRVERADGRPRA